MNNPTTLQYSKSHEWVEALPANSVRIGLTDFAQNALGDLVFVELPEVGDAVTAGESLGDVESVKSVSPVISPVTGVVTAVNAALLDAPESINEDPYGAWLVEVGDISRREELLNAEQYAAFCAEEG